MLDLPVSAVYGEVNMFCIALLGLLYFHSFYSLNKPPKSYRFLILSVILFVFIDLIWIVGTRRRSLSIANEYLINTFYYITFYLATFFSFIYAEVRLKIDKRIKDNIFVKIIARVPLIIGITLAATSFKTHWLFYIDDSGHFVRGPLFFVHVIIWICYIIVPSVNSFSKAMMRKNYLYKDEYMSIAFFAVIPTAMAIVKFIFPDSSIFNMGITGQILYIYLKAQDFRISIDPLTNINNRNGLNNYLNSRITFDENFTPLFLLILDIDNFKEINDLYGHIEGDNVLVRVSKTLRDICNSEKHYIARYGGDEFIVVFLTDNEDEVTRLCEKINRRLRMLNKGANVPYDLTLSIGYSHNNKEIKDIEQLIEKADAQLYKVKRAKKRISF